MFHRSRVLLVSLAALALGLSSASAKPVVLAQYQNPDGTYSSPGDFVSAIEGRPCGVVCSQERAQEMTRERSSSIGERPKYRPQ